MPSSLSCASICRCLRLVKRRRVCARECPRTETCTHVLMHVLLLVCACAFIFVVCRVCVCVRACVCARACTRACVYTCVYVCACVRTIEVIPYSVWGQEATGVAMLPGTSILHTCNQVAIKPPVTTTLALGSAASVRAKYNLGRQAPCSNRSGATHVQQRSHARSTHLMVTARLLYDVEGASSSALAAARHCCCRTSAGVRTCRMGHCAALTQAPEPAFNAPCCSIAECC